jgi:hypothetical protein
MRHASSPMEGMPLQPPSRADVEEHLLELIDGRITRAEATDWAMQWVAALDAGVEDSVGWDALNNLVGADAISTDRPYLYNEADFQRGGLSSVARPTASRIGASCVKRMTRMRQCAGMSPGAFVVARWSA